MSPARSPRAAKRAAPQAAPGVVAARRTVLDNGLVVIVRPDRSTRSIALHLALRAGAGSDPAGRSGTASLAARLLDRGAGGVDARVIAHDFDALGIAVQSRARLDSLEVTARLLSRHLPFALERLRLLAAEPDFPAAEIEGERSRVLTEIAERDQDTAARADELLAAALFPAGHPYHAPPLGTRESVAAIGRDDLARFHASHARPQGAVLVMAGDLDAEEAADLAARSFSGWKNRATGTAGTPWPKAPAPNGARIVVLPIAGKTQADIAIGFDPAVDRRGADLQATLVMNSVLGDFGLGGRLGNAVRERAGLAYYAHSYVWAGTAPGPVVARAGVAPDGVRRAVSLMRRTIADYARTGPRPAELSDSKQALASAIPRRFETNAGGAALLADCEFQGLGYDYPDQVGGLIASVDRNAVREAARRYLTLDRSVLVVTGPDLKADDLR